MPLFLCTVERKTLKALLDAPHVALQGAEHDLDNLGVLGLLGLVLDVSDDDPDSLVKD